MRIISKSCLAGFALMAFTCASIPAITHAEEKADTYEMLNLFGDVFERVRSDYVEEVSDEQLVESAINGMLTALDPHSSFLNAKSFKEMQVQTKGEFGGLGIEVTMENGLVKVVSPIDDTPAYRAGIQAGDYISYIDDEPVLGLTLAEAVEKMRGQAGTKIAIDVLREGENEPLKITMTRDVIKIRSVRTHMEGDDIGYVRITSFSEKTYDTLKAEFDALKKKNEHLRGIVLDLRNNPGGLLDQAVAVADAFLNQGEVVSTRGRDPADTKRYSSEAGDITDGMPIVVLINNGSASASEIVAGALQDHKRAVVMGTASFGKGSVQTVIPLGEHGAMRLTTSRYYTPSGRSIQAKGIEPNIIVEQAKIEPVSSARMRMEADLRGRLKNDQGEKEKAAAEAKANKEHSETPDKKPVDDDKELKSEEDFQLSRAVDLLRGLEVYKDSVAF